MKRMFLFRSNLRPLEYYHQYKNLETFKLNCHDFYLLMGLWYVEHDYLDEFIVWRLQPEKKKEDIIFNIDGRKFIQKWVNSFDEIFKYPKPDISFFRGGFPEYDSIVKKNPDYFGFKIYLGAGKRTYPPPSIKYDLILLESEDDFNEQYQCDYFFKTVNPNIFKPINSKKEFDLCWVCNFTQITQKGQEFFIQEISKSDFLKSLKIVHCGNKPEVGKELCKKYNVTNINFIGWQERKNLNKVLNMNKFGIVTSNKQDGCPRVSTEILGSGIPLIIRNRTRLLEPYKNMGCVEFHDKTIQKNIQFAFENYDRLKLEITTYVLQRLSMRCICEINFNRWIGWMKKT